MTKKGNRSWKPFDLLDIQDKDPNYRYRWGHKDPANLTKKRAEGWLFAEKAIAKYKKSDATTKSASATDIDYADQSMTTMTEYNDLVLMVLPEEIALERDAYFQKRNAAQQQAAIIFQVRAAAVAARAMQMAQSAGVSAENFYTPTTID